MDAVLGYIESGKSEGAKLVAGGSRTDIGTGKGYFIHHHLRRRPEHRIAREEIFGPVLATIKFKDAEDAIARATTPSMAWPPRSGPATCRKPTASPAPSRGTVWVNTYNLYDPALPSEASRSPASAATRGGTLWKSTRRRRVCG
jgi:acyl-CoA reductase-like NAD-dependent aldehyde dehydrogenase